MKRSNLKTLGIYSIIAIPFIIFILFRLNPIEESVVAMFFFMSTFVYGIGIYMLLKPMLEVQDQLEEALNQFNDESSFLDISRVLNQYSEFKNPIYEFKKSLRSMNEINESTGISQTHYYSTVSAEHYFNEGSIIYSNLPYKTLNFLPQVLTGLGIFGTFLGVILGLPNFNSGMGSQEIQSTISGLLGGVQVSFRTSLYGIAYSIALTILIKILFDISISSINKLNIKIDRSLKKSAQNEGLKELEKQLEKQTSSIERLATDISQELGNKIDNSLNESMKKVGESMSQIASEIQKSFEGSMMKNIYPALERLGAVSEELGRRQEQSSDKFFQDTIERIEKVISMGTQNEIEKLKESLEVMSEKNNEFLSKFIDGMDNIEGLFASQKDLIKGTNNSVENINVTSENIKELQEGIKYLLTDISTLNNKNSQSVEGIERTFDKLKSFTSEQGIITDKLADMVTKTYEYGKTQENYMNTFNESTKMIESSISSSKLYIQDMTKDLKSYLDNFRSLKDMSFEITDKLNINFNDVINKLENSSVRLNESISKVNEDIISNVANVTNDITFVSKELKDFYTNINRLSVKIESFAEVEHSTQEMWKTYRQSFDELNKNINEGINNYTEAIKRGTNDVFEEYDSKIADAVKSLKSMVESLHDELDNIGDVFEEITVKSVANS